MEIDTARVADGSRIDEKRTAARTVRLPKFLVKEPVGLGQIVKRITTSIGVRPCASCEQRAARLDQWLRFSPREHGGTDHE